MTLNVYDMLDHCYVVLQLMLKCSSREEVPGLVAQIYTDHCTDSCDKLAVKSMVETLARYSTLPVSQVSPRTDTWTLSNCIKSYITIPYGLFSCLCALELNFIKD